MKCISRSQIQTQENKKSKYKCKKLNSLNINHTSKTAKIILKLSVCIFLNILLKTVILNYSTIWLLTPTLSKKLL